MRCNATRRIFFAAQDRYITDTKDSLSHKRMIPPYDNMFERADRASHLQFFVSVHPFFFHHPSSSATTPHKSIPFDIIIAAHGQSVRVLRPLHPNRVEQHRLKTPGAARFLLPSSFQTCFISPRPRTRNRHLHANIQNEKSKNIKRWSDTHAQRPTSSVYSLRRGLRPLRPTTAYMPGRYTTSTIPTKHGPTSTSSCQRRFRTCPYRHYHRRSTSRRSVSSSRGDATVPRGTNWFCPIGGRASTARAYRRR